LGGWFGGAAILALQFFPALFSSTYFESLGFFILLGKFINHLLLTSWDS
jgi:hypothetical protein